MSLLFTLLVVVHPYFLNNSLGNVPAQEIALLSTLMKRLRSSAIDSMSLQKYSIVPASYRYCKSSAGILSSCKRIFIVGIVQVDVSGTEWVLEISKTAILLFNWKKFFEVFTSSWYRILQIRKSTHQNLLLCLEFDQDTKYPVTYQLLAHKSVNLEHFPLLKLDFFVNNFKNKPGKLHGNKYIQKKGKGGIDLDNRWSSKLKL